MPEAFPNHFYCPDNSFEPLCKRSGPCQSRWFRGLIWLLLCFVSSAILAVGSEILNRIEQQYGISARQRVISWQHLIQSNQDKTIPEKLELVNQFFNQVQFVSDQQHWGKTDYWSTPLEFLVTNGGDCEDFSIAKYFTLRELGVPVDKMRLTYVKALSLNQAHMVMTFFPSVGAEPLVLDNLDGTIKPASKRRDLLPVYSFNGDGLWLAKERSSGRRVGNANRISLWNNLRERMRLEGLH